MIRITENIVIMVVTNTIMITIAATIETVALLASEPSAVCVLFNMFAREYIYHGKILPWQRYTNININVVSKIAAPLKSYL